jgi:arylsulfatase A-like enzyme
MLEENKKIVKERGYTAGPVECAEYPDNANRDGMLADKTISDLRRLKDKDQPFFIATGFWKPHLPFNAPKKYWDMYDRDKIDLADNPFRPKGCPDRAMHNWGELRNYYGVPKEGPVSDEMAKELIHGYYACVSYVDAQLGRVLDELEALGLSDNTIVIVWGDHGWSLGEHGLWAKHCNFETCLHSPMIIRAPGLTEGQQCAALTEFVDIYPTLCDLCGVEPPKNQLEGSSLVPLLKDPKRPWKDAAFSQWNDGASMRTDQYLYTEWPANNERPATRMLYDHHADPGENVNIAEDPAMAETVKALHEKLQAGWKAVKVPQ